MAVAVLICRTLLSSSHKSSRRRVYRLLSPYPSGLSNLGPFRECADDAGAREVGDQAKEDVFSYKVRDRDDQLRRLLRSSGRKISQRRSWRLL